MNPRPRAAKRRVTDEQMQWTSKEVEKLLEQAEGLLCGFVLRRDRDVVEALTDPLYALLGDALNEHMANPYHYRGTTPDS